MRVPLDRLFSEPPITGMDVEGIRWHPDGRSLSYLQATGEEGVSDLWSYELQGGARARLVDGRSVKAAAGEAALSGYDWLPDGRTLLLSAAGKAWLYEPARSGLRPLLEDLDEQVSPHLSPTGRRVAFVRRGDLWVKDLESDEERALTSDGGESLLNGKLDWVYWEELANRQGWRAFEWSPDGERIAFLRLDQARVPEYPLVDAREVRAVLVGQRYPKAGDPNSMPAIRIADAASGAVLATVDLEDDAHYIGPRPVWSPGGREVFWTRLTRSQQSLELRALSSEGEDRCVLAETDPFWLNRIGPPHFVPDGSFLWLSERSGRAHVYHYSADGVMLRQVTDGAYQVEEIHGVEEGCVVLTGTGTDPRARRLYRVPLSGGAAAALTPEKACAGTVWRKDGGAGVVTLASADAPPERFVLRGAGLEPFRQPDPAWRDYTWAGSEFHDVTAADGTVLHGRLILPPDFDPAERCPVVVHVYGGPHAQNVRYQWAGADPLDQLLAQEGVLVWRLDNRGTWGRGHAFETPVHRRLYVTELADQLAGVAYLKTLPYVDPDRIGITGWSYGGSMTLFALTRAPEVWRCGAAGAPVTDWELYDSIYTERYMGTPDENPEGYREVSILRGVSALRAPLLLMHGTDDDNVHLQNTLQLLERLAEHRKPYELLLQPGQKHGFKGQAARTYLHERLVEFLLRHLSRAQS